MTQEQIEREDFLVSGNGHPDYVRMIVEIAQRAREGWELRKVSLVFSRRVFGDTLRKPDAQRVEIHSGKPESKGTERK